MVRHAADLREVRAAADLLGHGPEMLMKTYAHALPESVRTPTSEIERSGWSGWRPLVALRLTRQGNPRAALVISKPNRTLVGLKKRAENSLTDSQFIRNAFVDVANTLELLHNGNDQIVLGRRGSGKTHTLLALAENLREAGQIALFVDLRDIGSNSSVYSDPSLSLAERGSRLFLDVAGAMHEALKTAIYSNEALSGLLGHADVPIKLDELASACTEVRLEGSSEIIDSLKASRSETSGYDVSVSAKPSVGVSARADGAQELERRSTRTGVQRCYVHFGRLRTAIQALVRELGKHRIFLLLDEWNSIPVDLQPYVGDLLRRALLPVDGVVVKIGAIQHRSHWTLTSGSQEYVGLELGSDIFADVNLDEFQVGFGRKLAQKFFSELLFKHVAADLEEARGGQIAMFESQEQLVQHVFTGRPAFEELVEAAEGVPRDGIAIVGIAAQLAAEDRINVAHVRDAARRWHEESKLSVVETHPQARRLMNYIVDTVIDKRRTRGFVIRQSEAREDELFSFLEDQRLLHRIKRSISAHDDPGVRFDAYVVDYGFYVDRKTSKSEPLPLKMVDANGVEQDLREVPGVDYRSVRKAVLSLSDFYRREVELSEVPATPDRPPEMPGQELLGLLRVEDGCETNRSVDGR